MINNKLLEDIISQLAEIERNTSEYDRYDSKLDEVTKLLKKQNSLLEDLVRKLR